MCCIWGSVFRSFTSVPLRGRGCWYWNANWAPGHCSPRNYSYPLYLFHLCTKEESQSRNYTLDSCSGCSPSQRWDQLWLRNISKLQPPTPNWELHWLQPPRIYIFIRFFLLFTPHLFFWLSLTQLQLLQFNLFLHKGPGVDTLISRGCFQRCLLPQVVSNYLWE